PGDARTELRVFSDVFSAVVACCLAAVVVILVGDGEYRSERIAAHVGDRRTLPLWVVLRGGEGGREGQFLARGMHERGPQHELAVLKRWGLQQRQAVTLQHRTKLRAKIATRRIFACDSR